MVPAGFRAEVYASGLTNPTALAFGPDGRLYATEDGGEVVTVAWGSSAPDFFAGGFTVPLGLTWLGDTLYVSSQGRVDALTLAGDRASDLRPIVTGLPFGEHQQDSIVVGTDGRLYVGSGSTCNACAEADPRSAAILSFAPDGSGLRVVAHGTRNPYGLAVQPGTGMLYATVNGIDYLDKPGDPEPADTLVRVQDGASYGWPDCWASARDLVLTGTKCSGVTPPAAYLEPHSSADGLVFYTGSSFPPEYAGNAFIAEWGQYDSEAHGRKLVRVVLGPDGTAPISDVSVFASGFEHPLALVVDPQGALLVADYGRGVIYRIQAEGAA
jgi:glucose/arabinose dehydrogenase